MIDENQLVTIRCTKKRYFPEYHKIMVCNRKLAEVMPGSAGRAFCPSCRKYGKQVKDAGIDPYVYYEVDKDYNATKKELTYIKVQK